MGAALRLLREFFEKIGIEIDKRTAASLLVLLVILILIPIGLFLVRQTQIFQPKAAGELIQLGDGGCIKINKSKEKAVDCGLVPLKLTNPFFKATTGSSGSSLPAVSSSPISSGSSPVPSGSSPAPSSSNNSGPQNVDVRNFNNDIQAALDSIKQTGGSVYLPERTYQVSKKIRLFSDTTLFGDGIDKTIIEATANLSATDSVIGNDSNAGQNNVVLRDMTVIGNGNSDVIRFRNLDKGYIYEVKAGNAVTGILLGFQNDNGVNNVRVSNCQVYGTLEHGIFMTMGENNVIDNCKVDGQGSKSLGIGLEIAVDGKISGNRVIDNTVSNGNHSLTFTAGGTETGYESTWINSDNIVCYNNAYSNDIQPIWDGRGKNNLYVGNNVPVNNVKSFGYTEKSGTDSRCDIPASFNIPAQPPKPTAKSNSFFGGLIKTAHAQSAGQSSKLRYRLAETEAGLSQASWREVAFVPGQSGFAALLDNIYPEVYAQDNDDQFLNAQDPNSDDDFLINGSGAPSSRPSSNTNPAIGPEFINTTFQLSNTTPGPKQIWVEFLHPNGASRKGVVNFNLIDKAPQISGLACNLDVSKQNLKITIDGEHFGNTMGTIESVSPAAKPEVFGWNDRQIVAILKKPSIPINEGQRFKIKLTRSDGFESGIATCAVDKSLVSLGARIFCREPGKFDASDVIVNLIYNPDPADLSKVNKVEEKVTINADGEIANLKTQLQVGKNYGLAIKAPNSLRRATVFTAREGTTQITQPNGDPFILPIGDIAPVILQDGQINTLDRSELIRQWRILGKATDKLSGDFNRDSKVNSIDWACMNYDFGKSDDPIPTFVPQSGSDIIKIPGGGEGGNTSGTLTIPFSSQKVSPTPNASASAAP